MNLGLLQRAFRETRGMTFILAMMLAMISGLLAFALPGIQARFVQNKFIPPGLQEFRNAVLGVEAASGSVSDIAFGIAWSHPVVMILLFAHGIVFCTRVPAAEVERGTIDVLLGLPVSRWKLFINETIAWAISGAVMLCAVYVGSRIGGGFVKAEYQPNWGRLAMVLGNLALVYAVVSCAAMFASTLVDRRGRAILGIVIVITGSILVNFLHQFDVLAFLKPLAPLSFLHYYKPATTLMRGEWPVKDLCVLGGAAATLWTLAGVVLSRRGLTTL